MTELAMRTDTTPGALDTYQSVTFDRIASWAKAAKAAHEIAVSLVQTSFVPEAFRGKAGEATAAILAGAEVGLDPMAALRSFDIIQGTAAPRAMTLRAVLQSRGHQIWVEESTATRAIVHGIRFGETKVHKSVWTLDRAKQLGLLSKKNWQAQPQAMLIARATSECARLVASDAILGIPYSSEELDDEGTVTPDVAPETKPARRTAQRAARAAAEPAPEPEFDEPAGAEPDAPAPPEEWARRHRKMMAEFTEAGMGTDKQRPQRMAGIAAVVGHAVASSNDLTIYEIEMVIDALKRRKAPQSTSEPEVDAEWPLTAGIPGDFDGSVGNE